MATTTADTCTQKLEIANQPR